MSLQELNKRESVGSIIGRLIEKNVECDVTAIEALEFRREQYGLNRAQFAFVLGLSRSHYSEFVSGKRALPIKSLAKAYAIGVPANALLANICGERSAKYPKKIYRRRKEEAA